MKITSAIFVISLLLSFQLKAIAGANQPRIFCDQTAYDFGTVDQSNTVEHVFVIVNQGAAPLEMSYVHACCGATAVLATNRLAPGESMELITRTVLKGRNGTMKKSFYIKSNDPQEPYYQLCIEGIVINGDMPSAKPLPVLAQASPTDVDFGRIRDDTVVQHTISIHAPSTALRVTNMLCSASWFRAEIRSDGSNKTIEVAISTMPTLPQGSLDGFLTIWTDLPSRIPLKVPVRATVFGDLFVMPPELVLMDNGNVTNFLTRYVSIRSHSSQPFQITKIDVPDISIQVSKESLVSGGYRLTLSNILPLKDSADLVLTITTDSGVIKKIPIPFRVLPTYCWNIDSGNKFRKAHPTAILMETLWTDGLCEPVGIDRLCAAITWADGATFIGDQKQFIRERIRKMIERINEKMESNDCPYYCWITRIGSISHRPFQMVVDPSKVTTYWQGAELRSRLRGRTKEVHIEILAAQHIKGMPMLAVGDLIRCRLEIPISGYPHIFHVDANGAVDKMFPAPGSKKVTVRGGEVVEFPNDLLKEGFWWRVGKTEGCPSGTQRIMVIVSRLDVKVNASHLQRYGVEVKTRGAVQVQPEFEQLMPGSIAFGSASYGMCLLSSRRR